MGLPSICYGLLVYESFLIAAANVGIALRFVAMRMVRRKIEPHDFLAISALVGCMGYIIATMIGTANYGYGYHMDQVPPKKLTLALKVFWAVEPFWALSTVSFRIAILLLYVELFGLVKKLRWTAWVLLGIVAAWGLSCILSQLLFCRPIKANWDVNVHGHCGNTLGILVISAAINMALDIVIVTLPLPIIWKLHMTLRKKIGATLQFSLGLLLAGVNVGRIVLPLRCGTTDTTYCSPGTFMLSATELSGGIWAACLPTLGPLFTYGCDHSNGIFPSKATDHNTNHKSTTAGKDLDDVSDVDYTAFMQRAMARPQSQAFNGSGEVSDLASTLREDNESTKERTSGEEDTHTMHENQPNPPADPGVIWVSQEYDVGRITRNNSVLDPMQPLR